MSDLVKLLELFQKYQEKNSPEAKELADLERELKKLQVVEKKLDVVTKAKSSGLSPEGILASLGVTALVSNPAPALAAPIITYEDAESLPNNHMTFEQANNLAAGALDCVRTGPLTPEDHANFAQAVQDLKSERAEFDAIIKDLETQIEQTHRSINQMLGRRR